MTAKISRVDYFYTTVKDRPGEACAVLTELATAGVNLLAFSAIPQGAGATQLVLYPEHIENLARAAEGADLVLTGPHHAFLIQGDDQLGALVGIHQKLCDASINVASSSGVTDGRGGYGYIIRVKAGDFEAAAQALGA